MFQCVYEFDRNKVLLFHIRLKHFDIPFHFFFHREFYFGFKSVISSKFIGNLFPYKVSGKKATSFESARCRWIDSTRAAPRD